MFKRIGEFFTSIGNNIRKAFSYFREATPTFLSVVASIAIIHYLLSSYNMMNNWWSLPLLAGIAGLSALIIPVLGKHYTPVWSIVSTGWTILLTQSILDFLPLAKFGNLIAVIFTVATVTEILLNNLSKNAWGEAILNYILSLLAAWILIKVEENALAVLGSLIVIYVLVIISKLNISLSFKKHKNQPVADNVETDNPTE